MSHTSEALIPDQPHSHWWAWHGNRCFANSESDTPFQARLSWCTQTPAFELAADHRRYLLLCPLLRSHFLNNPSDSEPTGSWNAEISTLHTERHAQTALEQNAVASLRTPAMPVKGQLAPLLSALDELTASRCRRIGKDCVQSGTKRKREGKMAKKSRNEQLEAKIDGLVSLLASATNGSDTVSTRAGAERVGTQSTSFEALPRPTSELPKGANVSALQSLQVLAGYPVEDEQELLNEFLTLKLIHVPFLSIPPQTSAANLRTTQPFLWLCIQAVSTRSTLQQSKLYGHIRSILGVSMVSELERSLEQLLGILICIAWGNLQIHRRPFLTIFTQLAVSAVFDLGLNEKPPSGPDERANYRFHTPWISSTRTMAERRAVLGCYFLTSIVSGYLGRIDTLRWTSHMTECLEYLSTSKECQGDLILVALVKLQRMTEKIRESPLQARSLEKERVIPHSQFYVKVLEAELDRIEQEVPTEIRQDRVVLKYLHHTSLRIHEFCFLVDIPVHIGPDFNRVEALFKCLSAIKAYFDIFLAFAPGEYAGFSTPTFFQLTHCLHCLYKLSAIEDAGWDRNEVAKLADLVLIGRLVVQNFREAVVAAGFNSDGPEDHLTKLASLVESAIGSWQSKLQAKFVNSPPVIREENVGPGITEEFVPGFMDDFWFTDLLMPLES